MIARNILYLWAIVPVNFNAGCMIFALALLWVAHRREQGQLSGELTCH